MLWQEEISLIIYSKEEVIRLTREWKGERFEDGRPKVPEKYLEKLRAMTLEEIWLPLYVKGYEFQFEGGFRTLHQGKKLVGRAVTGTFMPTRPDLFGVVNDVGKSNGWKGTCNQWMVDELQKSDVVVVDMFDKIHNGTFVGGNLTTAIRAKTVDGGAVIWGGVRDIEQMQKIDTQVCFRGVDPTPIRACVMTEYNGPCRIGKAVCLPGDVVMATQSGVLFIPSHLVAEVINQAEKAHVKDIFGFEMLQRGIYSTAEIDATVWSTEMLERMQTFIKEDPRCEKYVDVDWSLELDAAQGEEKAFTELMKYHLV